MDAITKTTEKIVPITKTKKYRNKWWTDDLQRLKTAYKKAKKGKNKQNKIKAKLDYEMAINKAKQEAWRKFLESVEGQNDVYVKYKILCKKGRKVELPSILVNGKYTNTFEKTAIELNKANFPDLQRPLTLEQQKIEDEVSQYFREVTSEKKEDDITLGEIEVALAGMKTNKAPGQDRIPTMVLKKAWKTLAPKITSLFKKIVQGR